MAGVKRVDYAEYTQLFQKFDHVPVGVKQSLAYSEYIDDLLEYLVSFFKKTQPLVVRAKAAAAPGLPGATALTPAPPPSAPGH